MQGWVLGGAPHELVHCSMMDDGFSSGGALPEGFERELSPLWSATESAQKTDDMLAWTTYRRQCGCTRVASADVFDRLEHCTFRG